MNTTTKKVLLSLGATTLLTSTLLAYGGQGCQGKQNGAYKNTTSKQQGCNKGSKNNKAMMKKGKQQNKNGKMIKMMMMLDLTNKQRVQAQTIIQDSRKNIVMPCDAFTDKNFDQAKFIKIIKEKRENKIEKNAETISKIYAILTPAQKKDLRTMFDMKKIMMKKKGVCNGQNCNGRR